MRRALLPAAVVLAVAAPSTDAIERTVDMPDKFFVPQNLTVLAGDTVTWTNSDQFDHDISALNGAFDSGHVSPGARFSHQFTLTGHYAYRCTIHPFMAGAVDVYAFQLLGPTGAISAGSPVTLHGIAPGGTSSVRIEARRPDLTWAPVTAVAPAPDGSFRVRGDPRRPHHLSRGRRGRPEPAAAAARRGGARHARDAPKGRALQDPRDRPAGPGRRARRAPALLARALPLAPGRARDVDRSSRVSFTVSPPGRYAARVVLLNGKGGYGRSCRPDAAHRRARRQAHAAQGTRATARAPSPHVATCGSSARGPAS